MTVCVAVRVNDGIVFAADSASSITITKPNGETEITNVYKHGIKVFNLFKRRPIAAVTCGLGNFGSSSIATIAKNFRFSLVNGDPAMRLNADSYEIEEVVVKAQAFFYEQFMAVDEPRPMDRFEFWIGGFPSDMARSYELWKFVIEDGLSPGPIRLCEPGAAGLTWGGSPSPISRLVVGYDGLLTRSLEVALNLDDPTRLPELMAFLRSQTEVALASPMMPIQDAIDLADFLVETTKRFYRFLPGADIVGGDTDIGTVTRHEGFKWIRRKHYYDQQLNRLENDHV